jgi:arylsulfatase A-like enzyme
VALTHHVPQVVLMQAGFNLHPSLYPLAASAFGHRLFPALAAAADNADPDRLADRVIDALDDVSRRGPFLLTAFFSTPHYPYAAPDPYYRRSADPSYRGRYLYYKPVDPAGGAVRPSDEDVAQVRALYDGAVGAVDAAIGRILDALARRGLERRTIVVVLADHGEDLYEPGHIQGHGEHLRGDKMTHIPLLVVDPVHGFPAHRVPGIVRDVDLAPTLAALAGAHLAPTDGVDLAPLLRGAETSLGLEAFAETGLWLIPSGPGFGPDDRLPYPSLPALVTVAPDDDIVLRPDLSRRVVAAKHRALRTERWKLLYEPTLDGVHLRLFDLVADPEERVDVASQHQDVVAALRPRLYRWMKEDGSVEQAGFVVPPP